MSSWDSAALDACEKKTKILFVRDPETLKRTATDFGLLNHGHCNAVAAPHDAESAQQLFIYANQQQLPLTLRGKGFSQGGQTVATAGGVVVETGKLNKVSEPDLKTNTIKCQAGASWQAVIAKTTPHGLLPRVMPFNEELTVGGTLSVGGTGGTTHHYGHIVNNVAELEVITGSGEHLTCSPQQNPALFQATLGGLGQVSMIISATLFLRAIKPHVRSFYLIYDNHKTFLSDQQRLINDKRCTYLEGFCSGAMQGFRNTTEGRKPFAHWFYSLQIAYEYTQGEAPEANEVLEGLRYYKHVHTEDNDTVNFTNRYSPRFSFMRKTGAFELVHPWLECLLPQESLQTLLPEFLSALPPSLGDYHRVYPVAPSNTLSSFVLPDTSSIAGFTILPMGIPAHSQQEALEAIRKLHLQIISAGGKRYLSGWLDTMDQNAWKQHYGSYYNTWVNAKKTFDPHQILRSMLFQNNPKFGS